MKNLIVELRLDGKLPIPAENHDRDAVVVRALLDKIHLNVVNFVRYTEVGEVYERDEITNRKALVNDETVLFVNLDVVPDNESFYKDGYNLLKYIGDALDFRPAHVTSCYEREETKFSITFIEITVGNVVDGKEIA